MTVEWLLAWPKCHSELAEWVLEAAANIQSRPSNLQFAYRLHSIHSSMRIASNPQQRDCPRRFDAAHMLIATRLSCVSTQLALLLSCGDLLFYPADRNSAQQVHE